MNETVFHREDQKYSSLWMDKYKDANWKRLAKTGLKLTESLNENPSIIDFGFGRGSAMNFFYQNGLYVEGVEISKYAVKQQNRGNKVHHSSLDNLSMLETNKFNVGFCNDVIEHIPEELVLPSLNEMTRVCSDYLLLSVCPTPSHHLSLDGENLHLTVKPELWWEDLLQRYGEVQKVKFFFSRSLRYIIDLRIDSKNNLRNLN